MFGVQRAITTKVGSLVKVYERKGGQLSVSAEMINSLCISLPGKSVQAPQDGNSVDWTV